jgi:hypothetical protein
MKVLVQHGLDRCVSAPRERSFLVNSKVGLATVFGTVAFLAWPVTPVFAGTIPGSFRQIDMDDGGYMPVVIQHPSGRLYGRTDGGGVYRSDNHGDTWIFLSGDFTTDGALVVQGIAVQQSGGSSSNLLLQATGCNDLPNDTSRGIWKTTDGGANWTHRLSNVNFSGGDQERIGGDCIIFHPGVDTEAWAGSRGQGMWKSVDSGDTWTEVGGATLSNVIFTSVCINTGFPDQVFAAGDGGIWVSVNRGTSWTKLKTYDLIMRVARKSNGTVFFCGNSGGSQVIQKITASDWANTATYTYTDLHAGYISGASDNGGALTCLLVLRDGRVIAGDVNGYTRISNNDGGSFTSLPSTPVNGVPVPKWAKATTVWHANSLVQDVAQTNTWYGGAGYGPIRTDDGGQTWRYICTGIGQVVTYKVCFHPTNPNRIYIPCADHGAAVITDGGVSGNVAAMATQFFPWPNEICMFSHRALSATINGTNRVIFPGGGQINNASAQLYETLDDGASWFKPAAANLPTATGSQIVDAMDSKDNPDDFLVVCGGVTGAGGGGIYRTTNGGASFTQSSGLPSGQDLGGAFWFNASLDRDATNLAVRYFYLRQYPPTTGGGFFRSTDRGVSWTQTWAPNGSWYGTIVADHVRSSNLWFSCSTGSKGLASSTDGGMTWNYDTSFSAVGVADALDGRICLFGQRTTDTWSKIYYSTNNGVSWDEITRAGYRFPNVRNLTIDPYQPGRIWIATDQRSVGIFTPDAAGAPVISSATAATGTVGVAFSYQIAASGSPTNYNATGLPNGLNVNRSNGLISGTPATNGTSSVTISAINSSGTGQATLTLTINAAPSAPVITSPLSAGGTVNQAFSYQIIATGNPTNYSVTGTLPTGLSFAGNTISGTPTAVGTNSVTIGAMNAAGTGTATLVISISASAPGPSGLVGWWKLDESSGTTAADSSGNGNNGTLSGGTWQASGGHIAGALHLNAFDVVNCGAAASLNTPSVTVAFWMNPDSLGNVIPVDKLPTTGSLGYAVKLRDTGTIWFRVGAEGGPALDVYGGSNIYTNGVWTHVACSFDAATGNMRMYINGVVESHQPTFAVTLNASNTTFRMGSTVEQYAGLLDDVRVYDHALTSNEVVTVMAGGGSTSNVPPPVITLGPISSQPGMIEFSWQSAVGAEYSVFRSTNLLAGWPAQPLTNNISGDGTMKFFMEPVGTLPEAFYRLKAAGN